MTDPDNRDRHPDPHGDQIIPGSPDPGGTPSASIGGGSTGAAAVVPPEGRGPGRMRGLVIALVAVVVVIVLFLALT